MRAAIEYVLEGRRQAGREGWRERDTRDKIGGGREGGSAGEGGR